MITIIFYALFYLSYQVTFVPLSFIILLPLVVGCVATGMSGPVSITVTADMMFILILSIDQYGTKQYISQIY